jgi:alkylation response protein AidB-like acyl-CoA dehydrogenase
LELSDSAELAAFRTQVRLWIAGHLPPGWNRHSVPTEDERWALFGRQWERRLHSARLNGASWPVAAGGQGLTLDHEVVILEESAAANVPESINNLAKTMLGPTLMDHGSDRQRKRYLPGILDGTTVWCQGFSEPNAGSDLAAVEARCQPSGDGDYRLSGQKIWTSLAHRADWMFALVRTEPGSVRHKGLSFVLLDMKQRGVEVRPILQMDGLSEFNEVFFDRAIVAADDVVGEPGEGWSVAMTMLGYERGLAHVGRYLRFQAQLDDLVALARRLEIAGSPVLDTYGERLMEIRAEIEVYRLSTYRLLSEKVSGPAGSVVKLFWNDMLQRMQALAVEITGDLSSAQGGQLPEAELWEGRYLASLSRTLAGGTSEIQRNIVAERLLGLPR